MLSPRLHQNILIVFCFFVYLFPFKAYGFDPRLLVFFIYFVLLLNNGFVVRFSKIKLMYLKVLTYPLLMMLFTIFASVFNAEPENTFLIFPFQTIYLLLLSYCIIYILKQYCRRVDFYVITKYFIISLIIQSIIAIIMFINTSVCMFVFELQGIDTTSKVIEMFYGVRLIGLGCLFFGGGSIYGLGLITLIPLMLNAEKKQILKLILLYVYIFVIGLFFARTCMIGCVLSILYLCCSVLIPQMGHKAFAILKRFISYTTVLGIAIVGIYNSSPELQDEYGDIVKFGFEAFINFAEEGEFSTNSSDGLKEYHLNIWPKDAKTYYIGDTRWTQGDGYYGDSDVGYIRLLFYFGVPGLLLFILYQYKVTKTFCDLYKNRVFSVFFIMVFFYSLILLVKGYIDIVSVMFIYLHYNKFDSTHEDRLLC